MDVSLPDDGRCKACVWVRDTYRRTGRSKTGFELHYIRRQCKRKPVDGDHCTQHGGRSTGQADG